MSASTPFSLPPSAVFAISMFLSSTLNVATSILVVSPSTNKFPVTRKSPSTSNVYSGNLEDVPVGSLVKIPTLSVLASI